MAAHLCAVYIADITTHHKGKAKYVLHIVPIRVIIYCVILLTIYLT